MRVFRSLFAVGIVALATGCASQLDELDNQALLPEIDIVQLKENSDEALKLSQEAKLDVQVVNTKLTELDNRLVVLSEEVSSVSTAKIEELENRLALVIEAYKDLQEQMSAIEVLPRIKTKPKPKPKGTKHAPKPEVPTFSPSTATGLVTSSEYEAYQAALRVFNTRKYEEASKLFADVLVKFPKGSYSSNAQYWIGECYYADGKFGEAISAFDKVLEYDRTPKGDDAQLKIGLSYLKLGKGANARDALKTLIDRYPNSEYVPRAKKYLTDIK